MKSFHLKQVFISVIHLRYYKNMINSENEETVEIVLGFTYVIILLFSYNHVLSLNKASSL